MSAKHVTISVDIDVDSAQEWVSAYVITEIGAAINKRMRSLIHFHNNDHSRLAFKVRQYERTGVTPEKRSTQVPETS